MVGQAICQIMADGKRLHLQHGPIDIVAEAFGSDAEISAAYRQGANFFETVLQRLVADLDHLRRPVLKDQNSNLQGIANDMWQAANLFAGNHFVTPMAAVAGTVADQVKEAMLAGRTLDKLYINNGGDIALHLTGKETFTSGIVHNLGAPEINGTLTLAAGDMVGGLATSGWRGRSLSFGVADAVTVLANNARHADVAATLIAGDVWVDSAAIEQVPAVRVRDDTELGDRLVTTAVGALADFERDEALQRGLKTAEKFYQQGWISGAYLALQGKTRSLSKRTEIQNWNVA